MEEYEDELDNGDVDQNNPVDMSADAWAEYYAKNPDAFDYPDPWD